MLQFYTIIFCVTSRIAITTTVKLAEFLGGKDIPTRTGKPTD